MRNRLFEHPFEPENRYNLNLKITVCESSKTFDAVLCVGYGLPIPLNSHTKSFYFTHHRSRRQKSGSLPEIRAYLHKAELAIKSELKENFFLVDNCRILVIYEQQPPTIINQFEISTAQALTLFERVRKTLFDLPGTETDGDKIIQKPCKS